MGADNLRKETFNFSRQSLSIESVYEIEPVIAWELITLLLYHSRRYNDSKK